ncbi:chemotaxis protein [Hylemonella gracilis str. Niagara R]|uniref:Chemotaxis protein n=1 Tax=Hylemonella gracilis str. Niagara R TaxID=1458275 RepID=A0A016XJB5_9BURK|nr:methyl-accepting chemotaxis protein [Hylemonella gracilis]EYC51637.1 chemotaxis protein [Hylemonella gracilis str. Niagara R]
MRMYFKVSTALTATLTLFVISFVLSAGAAMWIFQSDREAIEQLGRDNIERASEISDLSSRLFLARADLGQAKNQMESGLEEGRDEMLRRADVLLDGARASLQRLESKPDMSPSGRPLFEALVNTARQLESQSLTPLRTAVQGWNAVEANKLAGQALTQSLQRYIAAVDAFQAYALAQGRNAVAEAARMQGRAMAGAVVVLVTVLLLGLMLRLMFGRIILAPLREAGLHFDRMADGDLTGVIHDRGRNEIGGLYRAMARMQSGLGGAVTQVLQGVEQITAGTGHIADSSRDISARSAQQADALRQVSINLARLSETVTSNARHAGAASQQAREVARLAGAGGAEVNTVVASMEGIAAVSQRIGEIVGVVDGIAFQTNLLALNAAVEAARAGELGRGFAVVASEVRQLAQRSAEAAREIKVLIDTANQRVTQSVQQVGQAGATIALVVRSVDQVTEIVADISSDSARQADDVSALSGTVRELEGHSRDTAAGVAQAAVAARALAEQARGLRTAVSVFRLDASSAPRLPSTAHRPPLTASQVGMPEPANELFAARA